MNNTITGLKCILWIFNSRPCYLDLCFPQCKQYHFIIQLLYSIYIYPSIRMVGPKETIFTWKIHFHLNACVRIEIRNYFRNGEQQQRHREKNMQHTNNWMEQTNNHCENAYFFVGGKNDFREIEKKNICWQLAHM